MSEKLPRVTAANTIRVLEKGRVFLFTTEWKPQDLQEQRGEEGDRSLSFEEDSPPQSFGKHSQRCRFDGREI